MNSENIHAQIRELLETIQEQYETISAEKGQPPQIEFDILKENIRKIYDQIHSLQRLNDPFDKTERTRPEIKGMDRPKAAVKEEEKKEKEEAAESEMDLFANEEPAFNIKLKEAREKSLPQWPDPDQHLKELISINDKFIFINELFDGNLKEYNEAIETLNGFKEKNEAMDYLDLLRKKNLWELGSGTFMKMKEVLEKRYP